MIHGRTTEYGKTLLMAISFVIAMVSTSAQAIDTDIPAVIDAVWSQSDGIRPEIFYSQKKSGAWTEPVMITDDYYDNMYPVIDQDSSGRKWLFWTAYDNKKMEIRYTIGQDGEWADSTTLATENKIDVAPSVLIDKSDVVWLTWSGNNGATDDIFYATNKDGIWSEPKPVHQKNKVPDVLPVLELADDDVPVITWKSMIGGNSVTLITEWNGNEWSEATVVATDELEEQASDSSSEMVELPEFMPASGLVFLRVY